MSESYLTNSRIYFDDDNQIRMLDSESSKITNLLTNQSNEFLKDVSEFKDLVDKFIQIVFKISSSVEEAKIKALGSRNCLESIAKQKQAKKQELQALINEKQQKLERLLVQEQSLAQEEAEQLELIDRLTNHR